MRVFCPNCGSDNEAPEATRVTCRACAASFEAPRADGSTGAPAPAQPPQPAQPPSQPARPNLATPSAGWVAPQQAQPSQPMAPMGYGTPLQGQPWGAPLPPPGGTNPLAIASLITGALCCMPFPIAAVITGFLAIRQVDQSQGAQKGKGLAIAGIVLGIISTFLNLFFFIGIIANAN